MTTIHGYVFITTSMPRATEGSQRIYVDIAEFYAKGQANGWFETRDSQVHVVQCVHEKSWGCDNTGSLLQITPKNATRTEIQ